MFLFKFIAICDATFLLCYALVRYWSSFPLGLWVCNPEIVRGNWKEKELKIISEVKPNPLVNTCPTLYHYTEFTIWFDKIEVYFAICISTNFSFNAHFVLLCMLLYFCMASLLSCLCSIVLVNFLWPWDLLLPGFPCSNLFGLFSLSWFYFNL